MNTAPQVAIPRTRSEDFTMQIHAEGRWHRQTPDLTSTACGRRYHSGFCPPRRESYVGPLCPECFTPYEHERSAEIERRERAAAHPPETNGENK